MNDSQINKLRSFDTVAGVMSDEKVVLEKYSPIKNMWSQISNKLVEVKKVAAEQKTETKGITIDKDTAKRLMVNKTVKLAGCAFSYAIKNQNNELAQICNFTSGKMLKMSEQAAISVATGIYNRIEPIIDQLQDEMALPEDLVALKESIDLFSASREKKGSAKTSKKVNTQLLDQMIKEVSLLLKNHMDRYVNKVSDDEPVFYSRYFAARIIQDLGRGPSRQVETEELDSAAQSNATTIN